MTLSFMVVQFKYMFVNCVFCWNSVTKTLAVYKFRRKWRQVPTWYNNYDLLS